VVNDLLDDWLSSFRPPFGDSCGWFPLVASNQRLLGPKSGALSVDGHWEADEEARRLVEYAEPDAAQLPSAPSDGSRLIQPSNGQIAEKIGLRTRAEKPFTILVIVGGPAGLAAAVYGASEGLSTVMIEKGSRGRQGRVPDRELPGLPSGLKRRGSSSAGCDSG